MSLLDRRQKLTFTAVDMNILNPHDDSACAHVHIEFGLVYGLGLDGIWVWTHLRLQLGEELVEEDHFPGVLPEMGAVEIGRALLGALEKVRVVAHLAQLHERVEELDFAPAAHGIERLNILRQRLLVPI